LKLKPQSPAHDPHGIQARAVRRCRGIPDDGNARKPGNDLLEELQALGACLAHHDCEPGDVAARMREARHVAAADRVGMAREYDRNCRGRSLGGRGVDRRRRKDDIDLEPDEFFRQIVEPIEPPLGPTVFDGDVVALDPAQIA
jgi:hypothetical protein